MAKKTRETGNGTVIFGTKGEDTLDGTGDSYILSGGGGDDTYIVDDIGDEVDEKNNGGIDHVFSSIDWWLGQHLENLTLTGLTGTEPLSGTGNESDNEITGNSGNNRLDGLGGNDALDGGDGADSLYGGAGDDTLIGGTGADLIDGGSGSDTAIFAGSYDDYSFTWIGEELQITNSRDETDRLHNIEFVSFGGDVIAASDIGTGPLAVDDDGAGAEDTSVTITVLDNDLGNGISVASATNGAMGVVIVNDGGTVTYRPNENAFGTDTFSYTITDSNGLTSTASVTVDISSVNDLPVANADAYSVVADEVFTSTVGVLDNDEDPDGDELLVTSSAAETSAGGIVQMKSDGTFTYTPVAGFTGTDSFTYTADDGKGGQASATVTLTVDPAAPEAAGDSATVLEDGSVAISVLDNDTGEEIEVTSVTDGAIGTAMMNADGGITYTPFANANGADSFTYTITDSLGRTATASVSVDVSAVNDAPVASADSFTTTEGATLSGAVLGNDSDPDGDELTVSAYDQTGTAGGTVTMAADGSFSYTAANGFTGTDNFTYSVLDGNGGFSTASVSVSVEAASEPDAPAYYVEGLIFGDPYRLNADQSFGTSDTVTFAFAEETPSYYASDSFTRDNFNAFSAEQREATREALDAIASYSGLSFIETSGEDAEIVFGIADAGHLGFAFLPSSDAGGNNDADVWIDDAFVGAAFEPGSLVYKTLIHEIGHAIGLSHATLPAEEDNRQFTVMSSSPHPMQDVEPQTHMLYDVAAVQYLYGANASSALGDDTYSFSSLNGVVQTIWDAGGRDSLDLSAAAFGVSLDLRPGGYSTIDELGTDNLAIAYGTMIEDAIGGAYADRIIGNEADNRLTGGGGADVFGFAENWGNDTITDFVRGEDALDFSAAGIGYAELTVTSSGGDTTLAHGDHSVVLLGVQEIDQSDFLLA